MQIYVDGKFYDSGINPIVTFLNPEEKDAIKGSAFKDDMFTHTPKGMKTKDLEKLKKDAVVKMRAHNAKDL